MLVAAYDSDGSAKIGKVEIEVLPTAESKYGYRATVTKNELIPVGRNFHWLTDGYDDTAKIRLEQPSRFADDSELSSYASASLMIR